MLYMVRVGLVKPDIEWLDLLILHFIVCNGSRLLQILIQENFIMFEIIRARRLKVFFITSLSKIFKFIFVT